MAERRGRLMAISRGHRRAQAHAAAMEQHHMQHGRSRTRRKAVLDTGYYQSLPLCVMARPFVNT